MIRLYSSQIILLQNCLFTRASYEQENIRPIKLLPREITSLKHSASVRLETKFIQKPPGKVGSVASRRSTMSEVVLHVFKHAIGIINYSNFSILYLSSQHSILERVQLLKVSPFSAQTQDRSTLHVQEKIKTLLEEC